MVLLNDLESQVYYWFNTEPSKLLKSKGEIAMCINTLTECLAELEATYEGINEYEAYISQFVDEHDDIPHFYDIPDWKDEDLPF